MFTWQSFWFPKELSCMKALDKVVAVNPWKVREECTARRKRVTGCLIQQTSHWRFNSVKEELVISFKLYHETKLGWGFFHTISQKMGDKKQQAVQEFLGKGLLSFIGTSKHCFCRSMEPLPNFPSLCKLLVEKRLLTSLFCFFFRLVLPECKRIEATIRRIKVNFQINYTSRCVYNGISVTLWEIIVKRGLLETLILLKNILM